MNFQPQVLWLEDRCLPSTVMNLNDAGAGSLRQAILDTPAGGTVDFQPGLTGTIALTTGELAITNDLTIAGPGAGAITVSGSHTSRVFHIAANSTAAISGLSVADGQASEGGGISVDGTLNLSRCVISGNRASASGGGIFNSGTLSIADSTFSANRALNGDGGALNGSGSSETLVGVTFQDNDCSMLAASTVGDGGGGAINANDTLSLTDCSFTGNTASSPGGIARGGAVWGRTMTVSGCTFWGNTAGDVAPGSEGFGGAIHDDGPMTIVNSTIVGTPSTAAPTSPEEVAWGSASRPLPSRTVRSPATRTTAASAAAASPTFSATA